MKQVILLTSIISSLFTYNGPDNTASLAENIQGGWTLTPASKVFYYDSLGNMLKESVLPLHLSGTVLNVESDQFIIRNNNNTIQNIFYKFGENSSDSGSISISNVSVHDAEEIISLLHNHNVAIKRDKSNTLRIFCNYDKGCSSGLIDKSLNFDQVKVEMIFDKNSFFSDFLLPY